MNFVFNSCRAVLRRIVVASCLCAIVALTTAAFAQDGSQKSPPASAADAADDMTQVTPEREAAALTFAQRHHPELADLLTPLKSMDRARYDKAIQELFKTSEQLTKLQARTPDRYESELELWKIDSRIRLLVAQSTKSNSKEQREKIKSLLMNRDTVRLSQLESDRDKLAARLSKLESSINALRDNSAANAGKEADRLLKSVESSRQKSSKPTPAKAQPPANRTPAGT